MSERRGSKPSVEMFCPQVMDLCRGGEVFSHLARKKKRPKRPAPGLATNGAIGRSTFGASSSPPQSGTETLSSLRKILELRRFTEANAATLGSQMLASWRSERAWIYLLKLGKGARRLHCSKQAVGSASMAVPRQQLRTSTQRASCTGTSKQLGLTDDHVDRFHSSIFDVCMIG